MNRYLLKYMIATFPSNFTEAKTLVWLYSQYIQASDRQQFRHPKMGWNMDIGWGILVMSVDNPKTLILGVPCSLFVAIILLESFFK